MGFSSLGFMKKNHPQRKEVRPQFQVRPRLYHGNDIAIGPGKADLLEAIRKAGSIAAAAESMGMSYMRAWMLIRTMNGCFKAPLVQTKRGGAERGAAILTETGRIVLALYRRIEAQSLKATQASQKQLSAQLR
jgi:molybdate transport system regulatory protein